VLSHARGGTPGASTHDLGGHPVRPTLVGTIYGMNFQNMPELHWGFGYPFAIGLMGIVCLSLYLIFKRRDWL
jgi:Mg2+ and Co2+ transporter CorA